MFRRFSVFATSAAALVLTVGRAPLIAQPPAAGEAGDVEQLQFFEKTIRPVLVKECYSCHSATSEELEGGLALDTRSGIRQGGERGPAVVPGDVRRSLLIKAIRHAEDGLQMPPDKKLPEDVIANFERWIARGAIDPREADGTAVRSKADKYQVDPEQARAHWAFQLPRPVEVPAVHDGSWPKTDVDRFVLSALEERQLHPVGDADRRTLFRRLSFDLTGLPPTPGEVAAFVEDDSAEALEDAVDRLLASPRFGEKWARHWLDLARYAESTGKTVNFYYPHAWRYRDYVIAAFNADKPYDQFIREQLAGDLMPADDPRLTAERMIATGFLALGPKTLNERSGLKHELDVVDEQIDVTTQAFLGITVACARCHDHKFDPVPQADYYALAGIFRSTETCYGTVRYINAQRPSNLLDLPDGAEVAMAVPSLSDGERERVEQQIQSVRDSMENMSDPIQRFFAMGRISLLQARLTAFHADGTPKLLAMGVRDKPPGREFRRRPFRFGTGANAFTYDGSRTIADSPVFLRGEPDQPGDARIERGTVQILTQAPLKIPARTSGRLELANWIASGQNPLTARVMANRVWLQLFGRGLVPTPDDFGLAGQPPSHPELLDYLAVQFVEGGWSIKRLIKQLVLSRVYQLSSVADARAIEADPDNVLLWRMSPRRLDAEWLRDSMLAVSGQLILEPPSGSAVATAGEGPVERFGFSPIARSVDDPRNAHRSIYLPIVRDNMPEAMALFDAADPTLITARRDRTTVPAQGLFLLNNEFVTRAADAAAERLLEVTEVARRIDQAYLQFFGRSPTPAETARAEQFLDACRAQLGEGRFAVRRRERELWSIFCQALFATAEFQYRL